MTRSRELLLKVGVFGLQDLRRLAPIGDIGYLNDISFYHDYERSGLKKDLMKAFHEQREKYGWTVEGGETAWRCTDHWAYCPEIGLRWSVDSGD
jgi:hypothetical protein